MLLPSRPEALFSYGQQWSEGCTTTKFALWHAAPLNITVAGNRFDSWSVLRFTGFLPPMSHITVTGNTFEKSWIYVPQTGPMPIPMPSFDAFVEANHFSEPIFDTALKHVYVAINKLLCMVLTFMGCAFEEPIFDTALQVLSPIMTACIMGLSTLKAVPKVGSSNAQPMNVNARRTSVRQKDIAVPRRPIGRLIKNVGALDERSRYGA